MDVVEFYPSITENLLNEAINFAKNIAGAKITQEEKHIILHARKAFLFHRNPNNGEVIPWQKKNGDFDVTMGRLMARRYASWLDYTSFIKSKQTRD